MANLNLSSFVACLIIQVTTRAKLKYGNMRVHNVRVKSFGEAFAVLFNDGFQIFYCLRNRHFCYGYFFRILTCMCN